MGLGDSVLGDSVLGDSVLGDSVLGTRCSGLGLFVVSGFSRTNDTILGRITTATTSSLSI